MSLHPVLLFWAEPSDSETLAREVRALVADFEEHPRAERRLLVLTHDQVPATLPPGVVQPVYEWLLSPG